MNEKKQLASELLEKEESYLEYIKSQEAYIEKLQEGYKKLQAELDELGQENCRLHETVSMQEKELHKKEMEVIQLNGLLEEEKKNKTEAVFTHNHPVEHPRPIENLISHTHESKPSTLTNSNLYLPIAIIESSWISLVEQSSHIILSQTNSKLLELLFVICNAFQQLESSTKFLLRKYPVLRPCLQLQAICCAAEEGCQGTK